MRLPTIIKTYRADAEEFLVKGCVKEIEFSGETYQILVADKSMREGKAWAFVQLDSKNEIRDCFCSCENCDEDSACVHIATAYLRIFQGTSVPLHVRFEGSLWNRLFRCFADQYGENLDDLKLVAKKRCVCLREKKELFAIEAKTKEAVDYLKEIVQQRSIATEETSLKFSNLSLEEIELWREGRPSPQLKYELSYWNDFAKWLFFLQEEDPDYQIDFQYDKQGIPNRLIAIFNAIKASFFIDRAALLALIPALSTLRTPLSVDMTTQEGIAHIEYDRIKGALHVVPAKVKMPKGSLLVDGWRYEPRVGFHAIDQHGLLNTPTLRGKQIDELLNTHPTLIKQLLKGEEVHEEAIVPSYQLTFDENWNLHLIAYLFVPGDLILDYSRFFGDWVYVEDKGFYRLTNRQFDFIDTIIPSDQVPEFVTLHRDWLNTIREFETHLIGIESQLTYSLSEDSRLSFRRRVGLEGEAAAGKDFGSWIYVKGEGFYSKVTVSTGLTVRPGLILGQSQIAYFIRTNKEELLLVPGFYAEKCPLLSLGIDVKIVGNASIRVSPRYALIPEYEGRSYRFFDEMIYVDGVGFYELPAELRLPEAYREAHLIEGDALAQFLTIEYTALERFFLDKDPALVFPKMLPLRVKSIEKAEKRGKGWFTLELGYDSEVGWTPLPDVWTALKNKQQFIFSPSGLIDTTEERFKWLGNIKKNQIDLRNKMIHLSMMELFRLHAYEQLEMVNKGQKDYAASDMLLHDALNMDIVQDPDISLLRSQLRSYQHAGVVWLWSLYVHELSGLLCDEMGLGKTHQTMALMAAIHQLQHHVYGNKRARFVVVCPTSVIYHWQEKLEEFLPELKVFAFHGMGRSLEQFDDNYDVLLTSYGIWRIEIEKLKKIPFDLAIFDEIQIAKNHSSRVHQALLKVNAPVKLGLTGTPIENQLRELKSLFDIVLPGYMPREGEYQEFFVRPIEREQDPTRRNLLTRFIKPFVLRRKKNEVLKELPPKIEEIAHCDLLPAQRRLYDDVVEGARRRLVDELQDNQQPVPYVHIFALLSSLKQICDHPAVYHKDPDNYTEYESGKWALFLELLNEARESNQKVVVFSQYLFMLDIMENYLKEQGIEYATIRGATQRRGEQIKKFNHDPKCEVFLGSIQASGLGVDLTAGSVVIHYDRWWNAARENQATDRVHRIGQKRGVQVFKLVTKNSFEERIDQLIMKKGKLMEEVVSSDDYQFIKKFSREELIQLLF